MNQEARASGAITFIHFLNGCLMGIESKLITCSSQEEIDDIERGLVADGYLRFNLPSVHLEPKEYRITIWPVAARKSHGPNYMIGTLEYRPE